MTEQERLEEIRNTTMIDNHGVYPGAHLSKKDWDWLIQQAERVEELEATVTDEILVRKGYKYALDKYKNQNQRYKQAIEECLEIARGHVLSTPACSDIEVILSQALKGDTNA